MSLKKQVEDYKKCKSNTSVLESSISKFIENNIIDAGFEVTRINLDQNTSTDLIVFYPVLKVKDIFEKKDSHIRREFSNTLIYEYTLVDSEGVEIKIFEKAFIQPLSYSNEKSSISRVGIPKTYYINNIEYEVIVCQEQFLFYRGMDFFKMDALRETCKTIVIKYDDFVEQYLFEIKDMNKREENNYNNFLSKFAVTPCDQYCLDCIFNMKEEDTMEIKSDVANIKIRLDISRNDDYVTIRKDISDIFVTLRLPIMVIKLQLTSYVEVEGKKHVIEKSDIRVIRVSKDVTGKEVELTKLLELE